MWTSPAREDRRVGEHSRVHSTLEVQDTYDSMVAVVVLIGLLSPLWLQVHYQDQMHVDCN